MEAEISNVNSVPHVRHRLLSAVVPVLLILIGYVDPGKWVAAVDGGARFGYDLVALVFVFNLAAIFCQYSSARIGIVTGKSLAQICSNEYDAVTCVFLGVQAELSIIALDLTMVLGVAHGINILFGVELFSCIFLTAVDAILFPIFATTLERYRGKFTWICIAGFVFLCYVFAVLLSQPDISMSFSGNLMKLSGETAFALMSLLGANIMPHNFYLHSSITKDNQGPSNVSKGNLCYDHFLAIFGAFSGIFMVHYIMMVSAANVFYSNGLTLLTFQDAMTLMEQVFRSPVASFGFLLVVYLSNQITALANIGGQVVLLDFVKMKIPVWLHRAAVRILVVLASLYCLRSSGAEGMYQLLIFTQVMVALLLPSSVIPLFRVATSRQIMGTYKVSPFEEFLAHATFIGMLGLKLKFLLEMLFGNSDWVSNLWWNLGTSTSIFYVCLLVTACFCLCLMLWLLATPLKSASAQPDVQLCNWDIREDFPKPFAEKEVDNKSEGRYPLVESSQNEELLPAVEKALEGHPDEPPTKCDVRLPETIMESEQELRLTSEGETFSDFEPITSQGYHPDESVSALRSDSAAMDNDIIDSKLAEFKNTNIESVALIGKSAGTVRKLETRKENEVDNWEPEKSSVAVSSNSSSLTSDGPGSLKSISGKSDESGNGPGSLSRLAGLGRAARRQLAAVLDEFWGQLYDYHGLATPEAKAKKLDFLLGAVQKPLNSSPKVDMAGKELSSYLSTVGGRGSDLTNFSLYESSKKLGVQNSAELYGTQRGPSSSWSSQMRMLDAYVQNSSSNAVDYGERRYSSMRLPPSSDVWDFQPATIHGYQMAAYRAAKDKASDRWNFQMEAQAPKSPPLGSANFRDSLAFGMGTKLQNGLSTGQLPSFGNPVIARNSSFQSESIYSDAPMRGLVENPEGTPNTKKYYSLPDISGLAVPRRDLYMPDKSAQWGSQIGPGSSVGSLSYGTSLHSNSGPRIGTPLAFDELSPKVYRIPLSLQMTSSMDTGSLWSRQPSEQFGVADNNRNSGLNGKAGLGQNPTSTVDLEAKLLRSFRHCIVKLLKLEGSDWLFRQGNGVDEDLIDCVAAREKFLYEAEIREINRAVQMAEPQSLSSDRRSGSALKSDDSILTNLLLSSVPHCGEGCIWKADLIISFGVWCIHRVLDLSLMESRPELWGKYTYVLNRLQGLIDPAFSKPRTPMAPCFCLQIPASYQQRSSPPVSNGPLPPAAKPARGKYTTAATLLDIIKDVEIAISCRKGKSGTLAGDVAFPKGKENLVSVLKRYKRKLSNKLSGTIEGSGLLKV